MEFHLRLQFHSIPFLVETSSLAFSTHSLLKVPNSRIIPTLTFQFQSPDAEYLAAFHHVLMPIAYEVGMYHTTPHHTLTSPHPHTLTTCTPSHPQYNPELVIISCGFDAARGDPLGHYDITPSGYAHMTHLLTSLAEGKVVIALEVCMCVRL